MYNSKYFSEENLITLFYKIADLFEYDISYSYFNVPEGLAINITFYNSPVRRSFTAEISISENTLLEDVADMILREYANRLN